MYEVIGNLWFDAFDEQEREVLGAIERGLVRRFQTGVAELAEKRHRQRMTTMMQLEESAALGYPFRMSPELAKVAVLAITEDSKVRAEAHLEPIEAVSQTLPIIEEFAARHSLATA